MNQELSAANETARVVAIDRRDEEVIVIRFVMNDTPWQPRAKEVRLTKDLAEQLASMLADELEQSSQPFHYQFAR